MTPRDDLTASRTQQVNRLRALLLTGDDRDRQHARGALTVARLAAIAGRRIGTGATAEQQVRQAEARRLAGAIRQADTEVTANARQLTELVNRIAPACSSGAESARSARRRRSFHSPTRAAAGTRAPSLLAGTCPIPASSGKTVRWRLNRGGDRALNRAMHTIAQSRMISCPHTRDYVTKRRAEGKTTADPPLPQALHHPELFRALTTAMT